MSRSQPDNSTQNPTTRWLDWDGANGTVRYYDKEQKKNIDVGSDITFIVLDQLATVKGWHDSSESGIFANEVKDTRAETMLVRAFKAKQPIAEGFYKDIKDHVAAAGGYFTTNLYIAFREGTDALKLGSIQFKGAALRSWMDFSKANRKAIYEKAVRIKGFTEGKKGKIVFRMPKFEIKDISDETNDQAVDLDKTLQEFLAGYFKRTRSQQVESHTTDEPEDRSDHSTDGRDQDGDPNFAGEPDGGDENIPW